MRTRTPRAWPPLVLALAAAGAQAPERAPERARLEPYRIDVVDDATGRGVPLAFLRTTNGIEHVTDSAGRVAFAEPGLLGETVWFEVESPGYAAPVDGFGFCGVALRTEPGGRGRIELERRQVAERLVRTTGQGIWRDTRLLGLAPPIERPLVPGGVLGQDSVMTAVLGERVLWFFGDTTRAAHPLGLFEVAGARSAAPAALDPARGLALDYFTDADGRARALCPLEGPGAVWIDGLMVVRAGADAPGGASAREDATEVLVAHAVRVESLGVELERLLVRWNAEREVFEPWRALALDADLRPGGHPVRVLARDHEWFVFPTPYPTVRVRATLAAIGDPAAYEGFTCLAPGSAWSPDAPLERDAEGRLVWAWKRGTAPVTEAREAELVRAGRLSVSEGLARLVDVETGAAVRAHSGAIRWNAHRGRWVWILGVQGGSSFLGDVAYAEADTLLGPWLTARRVATHGEHSFYNVAQHDFLAREGGRLVVFEGTYTRTFSKAPRPTPRYDYNQLLYRLDLDDPRLAMPELVYAWGEDERGPLAALRAAGLRPADARPVAFARGESREPLPERALVLGTEEPAEP